MPAKADDTAIKTVRFVYEADHATLPQPHIHPIYVLHLVTRGTAVMSLGDKKYTLAVGDLFFAFPGIPYTVKGSADFAYIYISFMGSGAASLLAQFHVTLQALHYTGFSELCPFFQQAIRRLCPKNANTLTESLLLYALSFLAKEDEEDVPHTADKLFEPIVAYVDRHYRDSDMSLSRLSEEFSYTKQHLSKLFKKHLSIGFSGYLNALRVQYANELLAKGATSIAEIANVCGYKDSHYFSRVYKKHTGSTPTRRLRSFALDEKNGHKQ